MKSWLTAGVFCFGALGTLGASTHAQDILTPVSGVAGLAGTMTFGASEHAGGAAWIDYNNDYLPDLFISNGQGFSHYLFLNEGDGTFSDVSALIPKPNLQSEEVGGLFADIDNDGDSDLLVIVDAVSVLVDPQPFGGPNMLFRNDNGSFVQIAEMNGISDPLARRNSCGGFADYDRDGWVDLFLGRWTPGNPNGLSNLDRLLRNDGSGQFAIDITAKIDGYGRSSLSSTWFDADGDLWPDLYVGMAGRTAEGVSEPDSNDVYYGNFNQGVDFCECTGDPHIIGDDARLPRGIAVGDVDNDGDFDLYITDNDFEGPAPFGNVLYLSQGDGTFVDNSCDDAGICASDSWGAGWADFNRDGWLDLWVGTTDSLTLDVLYLNNGDGTFSVSPQTALFGNRNRGGSQADYDGDGDVDIVLVNQSQSVNLLRNDSADTNSWLSLRLLGVTSNRDAIGAVVKVTAGGITQMRMVSGGDGAHSQPELTLHFGLGASGVADVEVLWPSGTTQTFTSVSTQRFRLIDEELGLMGEQVLSPTVTWSSSQNVLSVSLGSNYGARTSPGILGFGALSYDATTRLWTANFAGVSSNPGLAIVTLSFGGSDVLSVTTIP